MLINEHSCKQGTIVNSTVGLQTNIQTKIPCIMFLILNLTLNKNQVTENFMHSEQIADKYSTDAVQMALTFQSKCCASAFSVVLCPLQTYEQLYMYIFAAVYAVVY